MKYAPGHKGPTLPGPKQNPNDPRLASPKPRLPMPKPRLPMPSQAIDPVRPTAPIGTKPRLPMVGTKPPAPTPTGPMVPVRGGGMAPASVATMMKKAPMMKKGGSVSSASKRADGCATKGKTKGRMI